MYKKAIYLENISNLLTGRTCETLETLTDTRAGVACTTTTTVITSRSTIAGVLFNRVVRNRCLSGCASGVVPFADKDSVTLSMETGRCGFLRHWVNDGKFVTRVSAPLFPLAVLFAGLFVHGIVRGRAFNGVTVDAAETDVAQTTVLHTGIPGLLVCDKEVVVVRSGDGLFIFVVLFSEHSLGVVNGKVGVTATCSVTRAIVRALRALTGTTFESRVANAFAS